MTVKISARPNGPYLIEGDVEIYDPTGAKVDTSAPSAPGLSATGGDSGFCNWSADLDGGGLRQRAMERRSRSRAIVV